MSIPRKKGPLTALRIDTPAQISHIAVTTGETSASSSTLSSAVSEPDDYIHFGTTTKSRSLRNMKKLSLTLPSAQSSTSSLASAFPPDPQNSTNTGRDFQPSDKRRLSIMSLPAVSTTATLLHRKEEEGSPTVPYQDGPIQVVPGVWLGSEDNARDWKGLLERGIKSILNVAKEVVSPFDSASTQPKRPFVSTSDLSEVSRVSKSTFYPAHLASGRPGLHYLKLQWSHGQSDLVREGFPAAMAFVDESLHRGEGVLIQCVSIVEYGLSHV
jgi:tyrosine-protein phosphatase MSG5